MGKCEEEQEECVYDMDRVAADVFPGSVWSLFSIRLIFRRNRDFLSAFGRTNVQFDGGFVCAWTAWCMVRDFL